jgi:hypothetical protein
VPVREVAADGHLERAEHADVEVPAAHHRKRVGVVKVGAAGEQRDRLLAGVHEIGILLPFRRRGAHSQQAVLAVQHDFTIGRKVVADERRKPDAQVHIRAFRNVPRDALGHLLS